MEQITLTDYSYVKIFKIAKNEIEKIDFCLCNQPAETLETFYNRQSKKPDLLINGGFFNMSNGATIFTYVDEKSLLSKDDSLMYGFGVEGDNNLVATTFDVNKREQRDFISAYPILIKDGKPYSSTVGKEIDYKARRTALGFDDNYIYVVLVDSPGLNFNGLKTLFTKLNVTQAINLDGGGSTRCLKNGVRVTSLIASRAVDNVVAFYLKKEPVVTTIYRVQTGAFSKQENAERYKAEIRALNDSIGAGYKNAYVRLIDGLYKVQVGAFSKKANAEKVVADLKAKGYNSFITTK